MYNGLEMGLEEAKKENIKFRNKQISTALNSLSNIYSQFEWISGNSEVSTPRKEKILSRLDILLEKQSQVIKEI
jgi:hypothetical protein